jgi:Nucleotidyl transferase AbiEii toxin, Type IV TA system
MRAFLKLSLSDQHETFAQAGARLKLAAFSVEKDFWVTWALEHLFSLASLKGSLTFKGGTSLSKAWDLIDRFSEDIDLTIDRKALGFGDGKSPEKAASRSQQTKRLEALKDACRAEIRDRVLPELLERIKADLGHRSASLILDKDDPDRQTLLFHYPSQFSAEGYRYIKPTVKIEFGARSDPWPAESRTVRPLAADAFPKVFEKQDHQVEALLPTRTFWEKAMLLHEESHRPAGRQLRPRMARHYYDLYQLIKKGVARQAVATPDLFDQVARHRQVFFRMAWMGDYASLKPGTLRIGPLPEHVEDWRGDYAAMAEMFRGDPPNFDSILQTIRAFQDEFNGSR